MQHIPAVAPETLLLSPSHLSPEQIAAYRADGFIAFAGVLSSEEVAAAKQSFSDIVERLRRDYVESSNSYGLVWASPHSSLKIQFVHGHAPGGAWDLELEAKIRKFHDFVGVDEFLTGLMQRQEKIRGVVSSLIGANPIPSQDMALVNPPLIGTGKPWHQDDAYFNIAPLDAVVGVWIALDAAGEDNGCMRFLPGWHQRGALMHHHTNDCEIIADRVAGYEDVPVPLPPGGAVFFSGTAPHHTLPNTTPLPRRALQFHYRSTDSRRVDDVEYDVLFAEPDGSPASCAAARRGGQL